MRYTEETLKELRKEPFIRPKAEQKFFKDPYGPEFLYMSYFDKEGNKCLNYQSCKELMAWYFGENMRGGTGGGYIPEGANFDKDVTRIGVAFDRTRPQEVIGAVSLLREVEKTQGFKRSKLIFGGSYPNNMEIWVFISDRRWQHAQPLLTFYFTLIRLGIIYKGGCWKKFVNNLNRTDYRSHYASACVNHWKAAGKYWEEKIIGNPISKVFGRDREKNYNKKVPSSLGFVALRTWNRPIKHMEHWKLPPVNETSEGVNK